jgi:hypothetical protein
MRIIAHLSMTCQIYSALHRSQTLKGDLCSLTDHLTHSLRMLTEPGALRDHLLTRLPKTEVSRRDRVSVWCLSLQRGVDHVYLIPVLACETIMETRIRLRSRLTPTIRMLPAEEIELGW